MKLFKQITRNESGQALLVVLAMLALGGLTIAPALDFAATTLAANNRLEAGVRGQYAAEAGVQEVVWSIAHSQPRPTQLTDPPNNMTVTMQTVAQGLYTIVLGELVQADGHYNYLNIHSSIGDYDAAWLGYPYSVTVTRQNTPSEIHVRSVGARLPFGYHYVATSANAPAFRGSNLSTAEPSITYDSGGCQMLNWQLSLPYPSVDPQVRQQFYIAGTGDRTGEYAWVVANRTDIGEVGELSGDLYMVTATATHAAQGTTARIETIVMMVSGAPKVISWEIGK